LGGLAACGGSGGGFAQPTQAVRAFQTAVIRHDSATACSVLTDSLKAAMIPGKVGIYSWQGCDQLAGVVFSHNAGVLLTQAQIGAVTASNGDTARVAIRMKLNIDDNPQPMVVKLVRDGGGWRIDDLCPSVCFKAAFIARRHSG